MRWQGVRSRSSEVEIPRSSGKTNPMSAFLIIGPTATGKSSLAVEFAERAGGEIVSADAFQVYSGLDILSAKPAPELRARVPHHLIGEVPLAARFDAGQWRKRAAQCIADIAARGRVPVVCGGSGLYIRALTHGLAEMPAADADLRAALEKEPLPALAARLRSLDPGSTVDMKNPRRVVRALEVCILTGRPFSSFRTGWEGDSPFGGVILTRAREELHARIAARTLAMFESGVVEEVAVAGEIGPTAGQMLGLREIRELLAGRMTRAECVEAIQGATRNYARRQLTWFRKERGCQWIDLTEASDPAGEVERAWSAASRISR